MLTIIKSRMLYEFHRQQSQKKPGSIHATYLLTGLRRTTESLAANGGFSKLSHDDYTHSSPIVSSLPNQDGSDERLPVRTVMLVRENDLESMRNYSPLSF